MKDYHDYDDAVSESVGFVILVSIITTAIAAVLMMGYPVFTNSVNDNHLHNMEEGFYLLSANGNKVALYDSPVQSSELKLYSGTIGVKNNGYFNISCHDTANHWTNNSTPVTVMEYQLNTNKIAYILGGVSINDSKNSVMKKEPLLYEYLDNNLKTLVIPVIYLQSDGTALGGEGTSHVTLKSPFYSKTAGTVGYPATFDIENVNQVVITTTTDYNEAFGNYLKNELNFTVSYSNQSMIAVKNYTSPVRVYRIDCYLTIKVE